jgi:hypothetical protein
MPPSEELGGDVSNTAREIAGALANASTGNCGTLDAVSNAGHSNAVSSMNNFIRKAPVAIFILQPGPPAKY